MEWQQFKPLDKKTPAEVIQEMIIGFSEATGNLVDLKVVPKNEIDIILSKIKSQFKYDLILYSSYVRGYKFSFFEFGHEITLYPCYIKIDDDITSQIEQQNSTIILSNEDEVQEIVKKIFASKKFLEVVSGLMKIAKNQDLPF